ncbi:hypothetical protein ACNKHV_14315 [Shigella flexneri]
MKALAGADRPARSAVTRSWSRAAELVLVNGETELGVHHRMVNVPNAGAIAGATARCHRARRYRYYAAS